VKTVRTACWRPFNYDYAQENETGRRGIIGDEVIGQDEMPAFSPLITIRQYREQTEALIAQSVLDSAGIYSFLMDENTIRVNWAYSDVLGGIRLQVAQEDARAAEEILSQPIPESIAVEGEKDYLQPKCPKCASLKIGSRLAGYWVCDDCQSTWLDDAEDES
jgi:hypothetical protein